MQINRKPYSKAIVYACRTKPVRQALSDMEDLRVTFEMPGWAFHYDGPVTQKQKSCAAAGVVASVSINRPIPDSKFSLSFYAIRDPDYGLAQQINAEQTCLPAIRAWIAKIQNLPETAPVGIEGFLVAWANGRLQFHEYYYHR